MDVVKVDGPCTCACHTLDASRALYHVVWRPCCDEPINGGVKANVITLKVGDEEYHVIADDEPQARKFLREYLDIYEKGMI